MTLFKIRGAQNTCAIYKIIENYFFIIIVDVLIFYRFCAYIYYIYYII